MQNARRAPGRVLVRRALVRSHLDQARDQVRGRGLGRLVRTKVHHIRAPGLVRISFSRQVMCRENPRMLASQ